MLLLICKIFLFYIISGDRVKANIEVIDQILRIIRVKSYITNVNYKIVLESSLKLNLIIPFISQSDLYQWRCQTVLISC